VKDTVCIHYNECLKRCTTPLPYLAICWRDLRSSWLRWQCWCDQHLVICTAMQTNLHKGTNPYKFIALPCISYFSIKKQWTYHAGCIYYFIRSSGLVSIFTINIWLVFVMEKNMCFLWARNWNHWNGWNEFQALIRKRFHNYNR